MSVSQPAQQIASPHHFQCSECDHIIDDRYETVWNQVVGWEKKRWQGGTNHLALRRPQDRFMCHTCMTRILDGLAAGQANLFEL